MAWDGPDKDKEHDPWSGRRKNDGPPELDELLGRFLKKLNRGVPPPNGGNTLPIKKLFLGILAGFFLLWVISGFFIVEPAEQAAILRFGRYVKTVGDGPHWIPRFFETAIIRDTKQIEKFSYNAQMLTKETNIVSVAITVQYRIADLKSYLFTNKNPEETLFHATASALRQVIGHMDLDSIMTTGRGLVKQSTQQLLETILEKYDIGIEIKDVTLQSARAPEPVRDAFNEAIKAQEIEQKYINEAQAYRSAVIPKAKGEAQRFIADAEAYSDQVMLQAEGDVARFNALLPQYLAAPSIMRERMYLETLESVFQKTTKVLVDAKGANNLFYLPLSSLLEKSTAKLPVETTDSDSDVEEGTASALPVKLEKMPDPRSRYEQGRDNYRGRGEE